MFPFAIAENCRENIPFELGELTVLFTFLSFHDVHKGIEWVVNCYFHTYIMTPPNPIILCHAMRKLFENNLMEFMLLVVTRSRRVTC